VEQIAPLFLDKASFVEYCLETAATQFKHVMEFTKIRAIEGMFSLIRKGIFNVIEYNSMHWELPLEQETSKEYIRNWVIFSIIWGVSGSMKLSDRILYSALISKKSPVKFPEPAIDYEIRIEDGQWYPWKSKVQTIEIEHSRISDADLIIPTIDTLRHQEVLLCWLSEHRPFILCGPPGSGKTMTLMSTLKALIDFELIFINFSSTTSTAIILKQFEHYCEYAKLNSGVTLRPKQPNKRLVVFCDEINLPDQDHYGTMVVISFLRELTEQHGFWRPSDRQWISLERIQFVGACNPPTDVGRKPLSQRFLRHTAVIFVDFPVLESLKQIYGTFNRAILRKVPALKSKAEALTNAMVSYYEENQLHFTSDKQPHYIYSPRELTRWKQAIYEAIDGIDTIDDLVRLWAHEALRLF